MRKLKYTRTLLLAVAVAVLSSCNDFLNDIPKGQKTPTTWEDFNAFLKNSNIAYYEMDQIFVLMGDQFKTPNALNSDELTRAHYYWEEDTDRTRINSGDKNAYYSAYEQMFLWNLVIDKAPEATECTQAQRDMLVAQAKVLRAMTYFYVTNYYSDQYCEATKDKLSVPLITSSSVGEAASPQVTLEQMYKFMVQDLEQAIPHLPKGAETILHPTLAAGYGLLARVCLSMGDYDKALENAELALQQNDRLYDWNAFYNADKARYDDPEDYSSACLSNPETVNAENYIFHYSSMNFWNGMKGTAYALTPERAAKFGKGDTRLLTHWKLRYSSSGIPFYAGIYGIEPNKGGIRSAEMYYIKAECLARKGNLEEALSTLDKVRKTRILPEFYEDSQAGSMEEAINLIIDDKANEFIQNIITFCDYRRLNKEGKYTRTLTKEENGKTYTLRPDSHLWIMPFPIEVLNNPGNDKITQNVDR